LTAGCSAVGGMEWRVLLFGGSSYGRPRVDCRLQCSSGDGIEGFVVWGISEILIDSLRLRISPAFP